MSYTVDTDLWNLSQRVSVLEVNSDKHNARLNKLEDGHDEKVMPEGVEGVDFSHTIPGKGYETATVKIKVSLDWYIRQFERVSKENEILKEDIAGAHERVKEHEKSNQMLRGTIENFKDRILELEEEVKYHKAFANSGKIKELEKLIEDYKVGARGIKKRILELEERNEKLQKLNDVYTKIILNEDE